MSIQLYYELYDYIFSFLHDDIQTLRTCSLVCRAWVPASQSYLFYHLILAATRQSSWQAKIRRFFAAILFSPHIARYVNKLSIQDHNYLFATSLSTEITLPPLLKKLSYLKELEFNFSLRDLKFTRWSAIASNEIKGAICSVPLEALTFRYISFNNIVDIIEILFACQNLKKLSLDNVDVLDTSPLSSTSLESILSLESLLKRSMASKKPSIEQLILKSNKATSFISILLHPRSPLDLSTLHHLNINVSPDDYSDFAKLLRFIPNLKFLKMDIDPSFEYDTHLTHMHLIDLSFVPSLVSLNLQVSFLLARIDPMPWMIAFLSTVGPQNALQDISLTFLLDKPSGPIITIQSFENTLAEWQTLDHLLTQSPFDVLRRIHLNFFMDNLTGDQSLQQEFISQLQRLSRKGVLEVDIFEL